jgi:uncharacterized membrane protein YcaP (DUF421 family)
MTIVQLILSVVLALIACYLAYEHSFPLATFLILLAIWILHLPTAFPVR